MATEIERKFLVKNLDFVKYGVPHKIRQGYICADKNRVVRVRIKDQQAFLTLKTASVGFARHEFEYEIPLADAQTMLAEMCRQPIISKTRFDLLHKGKKWEIDVFNNENEGLIIAEIELETQDETFAIPPFIGEEVTADIRYYNSFISENPFLNWKN
ncbi:MAG: CYTH domain-containing protein [Prevotellaceae bacterium]|jgi:CYTH domain-containing protein|nr:CYTH domain-containing protein [Prevotellaceae bacterium]